ncbi:unnamed protein product, partial [Mesorhabditis belari]|uniref:HIT-type domain-containing protein n=1 Tax=Mesorhabditis belari TaxID=2138241 RepID=A0AAF3ER07_9BILA
MENPIEGSSTSEKRRCPFCATQNVAKYECPRCHIHYCSIRCYRSKEHNKCSETFYENCVREHIDGPRRTGPPIETFEERMKKYVNGEMDDFPGSSDQPNEEGDGEVIDSDEEDDTYMKKVLDGAVQDYDLLETDIERQLTAMGVGLDDDALIDSLTEEEKAAFAHFSREIHQEEMGLGNSVFKKR